MPQQKVILKLDVHNDANCKKKVMKMVSSIPGIESISMDMKDKKVTVTGDMDPVSVVKKLRKTYNTEIVSVGPAKEPEKPKKPEEPKPVVQVTDFAHPLQVYYPSHKTYYYQPPYYSIVEEDPNACAIC